LKIAFYNLTTTIKSGGIETFNWEMAKALRKRGHCVHVYGGKSRFVFERPPDIPVFTYPFVRRDVIPDFGTRFRRLLERLSFGVFALGTLVRERYDYIYLIKPYDMPVALLARALSKARVIFGSSGTEFFAGYARLARGVDHFWACSEFNASQVADYCGMRPRVLPNGVDTDLFRPREREGELSKSLGLDSAETVVVSVGRLVGLKGFPYAIEAVGRLARGGVGIRYLVIGDGEERVNLMRLARNLGMEDRIRFLGNIAHSQLPLYYSLADMAVFPSVAQEAFGIAIAEAMACGIPVISTRMGGIPEVVPEGAGILVPPGDESSLAEAMERLRTDRGLRREMGGKGRLHVVERFGWDMVAEKFERYLACPHGGAAGNRGPVAQLQ
jgi:glycosyltransferase involved in cell wall biosynthesis